MQKQKLDAEHAEQEKVKEERTLAKQQAAASAAAVAASVGVDVTEIEQLRRQFKALSIQGTRGSDPARLFELLDKDLSGSLEFPEFQQAVRKEGKITAGHMSDAALRKLFRAVDLDAAGSIGVDELLSFLGPADGPGFDTSATLGKESKDSNFSVLQTTKKTAYEVKREKVAADLLTLRKKLQAASYGKGGRGTAGVSYEGLFRSFDRDNSGELDFDEFRKAIRKEGKLKANEWPDQQLRQLFRLVDADASGTITADEFVGWMGEAPTDSAASKKRGAIAAKKVHHKDAKKLGGDISKLKRNFHAVRSRTVFRSTLYLCISGSELERIPQHAAVFWV